MSVTEAVTAWEGVSVKPHRFGVEYVIGTREIGHIHGDHMLDVPFPKRSPLRLSTQAAPTRIIFCRRQAGRVSISAPKKTLRRRLTSCLTTTRSRLNRKLANRG